MKRPKFFRKTRPAPYIFLSDSQASKINLPADETSVVFLSPSLANHEQAAKLRGQEYLTAQTHTHAHARAHTHTHTPMKKKKNTPKPQPET